MLPFAAQIGSSTKPDVCGMPTIDTGSNCTGAGGVPTPLAASAAASAASEIVIGPPSCRSACKSSARTVATNVSFSPIESSSVARAPSAGTDTYPSHAAIVLIDNEATLAWVVSALCRAAFTPVTNSWRLPGSADVVDMVQYLVSDPVA